jgi:hypothetical protein
MQKFLKILRWTVGILFIFSGLIKANDPLGLSYKMDEFLSAWGISLLGDKTTLYFAFSMNILEIVAGLALIIKFPYKQTLWLLFGLIVFFSFLTGYALFSGKIKTCGCFGDCIPLTPKTSFIKDVLLLISIIILLFNQKKVKSKIKSSVGITILIFASLVVGYAQYYVLNHLPFIDCLPYKAGTDIAKKMNLPEGAIKDSVSIIILYKKNEKLYSFDAKNPASMPDDIDSYTYIDTKIDTISKGNGMKAETSNFVLYSTAGPSITNEVFANKKPYVLIFSDKIEKNVPWTNIIEKVKKNYDKLYIVNNDTTLALSLYPKENVLFIDNTLLKEVARVWPTIYIMNGSVITQKKSYIDFLKDK